MIAIVTIDNNIDDDNKSDNNDNNYDVDDNGDDGVYDYGDDGDGDTKIDHLNV